MKSLMEFLEVVASLFFNILIFGSIFSLLLFGIDLLGGLGNSFFNYHEYFLGVAIILIGARTIALGSSL